MVAAQTPTLARIKNEASETDARALLYIAICEVCDFFNVGKNMNDTQIAVTVDLILESFWYLRLEEIKFCFRRAMKREKLFDRLDGNIIIGWLRDYDAERTEEAMRLADQEASQLQNEIKADSGAISMVEYISGLERRAKTDEDAAKMLADIKGLLAKSRALTTAEEKTQKDRAFKTWKIFEYLHGNQT